MKIQQIVQFSFTIGLACAAGSAATKPVGREYLRADANLVLVSATALDSHNRVVRGLTQSEFRLFEDGVERKLVSFSEEELPVSVAILFDASGSMNGKLSQTRTALAALLKDSNPEDEFSLITFAGRAEVTVPWTHAEGDILNGAMPAQAKGSTALLDAVGMGVQQLRSSHNSRHVIVIISDGGDNHSRFTRGQLVAELEEANVQLYAVDVAPRSDPFADIDHAQIIGADLLGDLCDHAGGRYFTPNGQKELDTVADQIGKEIRSQYVLGFTPVALDGKYHRVQLKVVRPTGDSKICIYWRRGYKAQTN
jgi:Ca-activated chloride channel family protein